MTQSIEEAVREIVKAQHLGVGKVALVRLGLEAGMKLGREQAAEIAENGGYLNLEFPYDRARQHIAHAIRALP